MPRNSKGDLVRLVLNGRRWCIEVIPTLPGREGIIAEILATGIRAYGGRNREDMLIEVGYVMAALELTPTPSSGNSPTCETEKTPNGNPGGV